MTGIEHKTFVAMAGEHVEPANSDADTASTPGRPDVGGKSALASRLEISSKAVEKLDEIMGLPLEPRPRSRPCSERRPQRPTPRCRRRRRSTKARRAGNPWIVCRKSCGSRMRCGRGCRPGWNWGSAKQIENHLSPFPSLVTRDAGGSLRLGWEVSRLKFRRNPAGGSSMRDNPGHDRLSVATGSTRRRVPPAAR